MTGWYRKMTEQRSRQHPVSDGPVWKDYAYAAAPAVAYTLLSNVVYALLASGGMIRTPILLQAVSVAVCLAVFGWYAQREHVAVRSSKKTVYRYPAAFCYVMAVVMCGIVNNYIFAVIQSKFQDFSSGYAHVAEVFYKNELAVEIMTLCILVPVAEELVYRGFVYQRLRAKSSESVAAVLSALLFGALHFNLVQFFYAAVLGVLLAHIVYKTESLIAAMAAHMAANLVSVLWTETDWLDFLDQEGIRRYAAALFCLMLMGIFLSYGNQLMRHENRQQAS